MEGKTSMNRVWLQRFLRIGCGGLFVWAGFIKLFNLELMIEDIEGYQIIPEVFVAPLALILPSLEVVTGLALALGRAEKGALSILIVLMLVFTIALSSAWIRGLDITCGCFGSASFGSYTWWMLRDILILYALGLLFWLTNNNALEALRRD
ncbi:MAG: MauE/DoxX family redox-associated membrane protein [Bacteroidota bacterium]